MKCPNCGAGIGESMKNCPYCGTGLNFPAASSEKTMNNTGEQNLIQIQIQTNLSIDTDIDSRKCPKCKAMIPLSKVVVAKKAPTVGQWILAGLLGYFFISSFRLPINGNDSVVLPVKIMVIVAFGYLLCLLLWVMFTRKFWICPACHKLIKVKRNPGGR